MKFITKRMTHLEIAEVEGWNVAKCLEKNQFILDLPEELQKQLKRAKKEAKEKDQSKENKKSSSKRGYRSRRGGFRGSSGGFSGPGHHGGFQSGSGFKGGCGPCFSCGLAGHIAAFCPMKGAAPAHAGRQMS
jgi:hypothetical protein